MLILSELFYSIQGEGVRTGIPSIFIRVGKCNLSCPGFGCSYTVEGKIKTGCDSYHSVDSAFKHEWEYYDNYMDIIDKVDKIIPTFSTHNMIKPDIVITGGEPLLYWRDEVFQRLLAHYTSRGNKITIETNAAINIDFTKKYQNDIIFSMSVKLSSSGEPEHKRINIDNITNILEHNTQSYLKFVCSKDNWEQEYLEIKDILKSVPVYVEHVYLMPMGGNIEELNNNALFTIERSRDLGFRYSDRIHIRCWNDTRKV